MNVPIYTVAYSMVGVPGASRPDSVMWEEHCDLNLRFDVECLVIGLLAICKVSVQSLLPLYLLGCLAFICRSPPSSLGRNPLLHTCFTGYFLHLAAGLFILLMVSCDEKFLILM